VGCALIAGALFLCWLVKVVVVAVVAAFQTPYPWIALGLTGLGFAGYHGQRLFRAQRREKLFFDAVAALRASDPSAPELLAALEERVADQADALLVVAANAAARGQYDDALTAFDRATQHPTTMGALSGGLELQFFGLPRPICFGGAPLAPTTIERVRGHLLTLAGRPQQALEHLVVKPSDPDYLLGLCALAEAREALGDLKSATSTLRTAITTSAHDIALTRFFRYKLARLLEGGGATAAAIQEYQQLLADGEYQDAADRQAALMCAREDEERHAAEEREKKRREQEQQKLERTIALAEERLAEGDPTSATGLLHGALSMPGSAPLEASLRYKLADAFEAARMPERAAEQYEALIHRGDRGKAAARLEALRAAQEETRRRAIIERDGEVFHRTLEKIEAAKGPAGRRAALQAGLSVLEQPDMRERLMVEASKIEVQAVLDKVDGLKTVAAKRRNLLAALEAIRSDDVPDDLQVQQIRWLEQALADLEGK
jgi:hypothetical protein